MSKGSAKGTTYQRGECLNQHVLPTQPSCTAKATDDAVAGGSLARGTVLALRAREFAGIIKHAAKAFLTFQGVNRCDFILAQL